MITIIICRRKTMVFCSTIKPQSIHTEAFGYLAIGGPLVPGVIGTGCVRRKRDGSRYKDTFISAILHHMVILAIGIHERYRQQALGCTYHSKSSLVHSQWSIMVVN